MANRPNFLIIIADDLGFSDIGCFGAEIQTPHLDSLSRDGFRLLNYHTAAACSPTRAMVLSGTDAHLGGLGCLIEYKANPKGQKRWAGKAGYEGYLNHEVGVLPEILEDEGYHTMLAGKWHLGMRKEHGPWARGFRKSFTMLPGCSNHYGWEPVLENGHSGMMVGGRPIHAEDGVHVRMEPNMNEDPEGFYSSDKYAGKMIEYLSQRTEEEKAKPFFGYLAFSAPHWPLQAPKEVMNKYRGRYEDGPYALRSRRLSKLVELGIIPADIVPHEVVAPEVSEWDGFGEYEKQCSVRAMEAYAAMVDQMDHNIGKVMDYLKSTGEYDNTMVVFMSDNGAEGAALEAIPVLGDKIKEAIHQYYDNSLDNIGAWNSFTWLGPLWAQASTAPSRLYKCFPSEGGILVPAIVKPANGTFPHHWTPGGVNRSFSTCMDLAPTFLDLAGISLPAAPASAPESESSDWDSAPVVSSKIIHRGKAVHGMKGLSWANYFGRNLRADRLVENGKPLSGEWAIYPSDRAVGWELHAQAALRKGEYKIVFLRNTHGGKAVMDDQDDTSGWELFNVSKDPGETVDLSDKEPEKRKELLRHWDEYVTECGLVWGPNALDGGLSEEEAPHLHDVDLELQKTWLQVPSGQRPNL